MKSKQQTYAGILLPQEVVEGLEEVKLVLSGSLSTSDKRLSGIFNTITSSVGKMLRPAFLMLFANFNGEISRSNIILSAAIEMVHTASLLHDDVVDNACRRRDNCSFNSRFGSKIAILAGDYVVSSAFLLADDVADKKLFQMFFETMALMSKAELLQNANHNNFDIDQDTYFKIINGKTAVLFAKACMIGALNCQQESDKQAAEEFGSHFGIAYQLVNDYCDVFGKDHSGCGECNDIMNGSFTLPVIHCLSGDHRLELIRAFTDKDYIKAVDILRQNGSDQYALVQINKYKQAALDALEPFTYCNAKEALIAITNESLSV